MAELEIVHYGNPILRKTGKPVEQFNGDLKRLAKDMIGAMHTAEGIGLAAQQVDLALQFCVVDLRGSERDFECLIQQVADGGYIIAGGSKSTDIAGCRNHGDFDSYIIKLDADGNIKWQKLVGGSSYDASYWIKQTSDMGYIIAGESWSTDISGCTNHGGFDYYIIKLDNSGN